MKNISSIFNTQIKSLAIGKFDGVHLAHQVLLNALGSWGGVLIIAQEKKDFLTDFFLQKQIIQRPIFTLLLEEIREWSGEEFVLFLKRSFPKLSKIVVGYDFCFGKNRSCGTKDLQKYFNGEVVVIEEVKKDHLSIHTENIRYALQEGNIKEANALLGRLYCIRGEIISGQGLGKKMLYPTLNLKNQGFVLPKDGVYVTLFEEQKQWSVTFIGTRSTDLQFSIEVHLLEHEILDKKKKIVTLFFVQWLRENRIFEDFDLLKQQITKDIKQAQKCLKNTPI